MLGIAEDSVWAFRLRYPLCAFFRHNFSDIVDVFEEGYYYESYHICKRCGFSEITSSWDDPVYSQTDLKKYLNEPICSSEQEFDEVTQELATELANERATVEQLQAAIKEHRNAWGAGGDPTEYDKRLYDALE